MANPHQHGDGESLHWHENPELRRPVLICAFEGWNDAGEAASSAAGFLARRWNGRPLAEIDAEDFYDFTTTRPVVTLDEDRERHISWPENVFTALTVPESSDDVVVLVGTEPQLRWRTFSEQVLCVAQTIDARLVVTLGALLTDVPHTRPVPVYGRAHDPDTAGDLNLEVSSYEGPTGIVGVLHHACQEAGIPAVALWAAVPSYVSAATSPKAALALLERLQMLLDVNMVTTDLQIAAAAYERQVDELVAEDDETAEYVAQLEAAHDHEIEFGATDELEIVSVDESLDEADPDELVAEVEQFLRDQPE
ncbi:MAG: PAC2 family protein [Acidimicrobiia bacterium]|nr:PAC2 family protein [Acidimicrobiia bacterium]